MNPKNPRRPASRPGAVFVYAHTTRRVLVYKPPVNALPLRVRLLRSLIIARFGPVLSGDVAVSVGRYCIARGQARGRKYGHP